MGTPTRWGYIGRGTVGATLLKVVLFSAFLPYKATFMRMREREQNTTL